MSLLEKITYLTLLIILLVGIYFDFSDQAFFENSYAREDGILENTTAVMLFLGGALMFYRFLRLGRKRSGWFKFVTLGVAFALLFVAGEEISWGQRLFDVESTEFFLENNVQEETNFHNLEVGGVKLNKLIFGQILTVFILVYLIVFPILFKRWKKFGTLVHKFAIPIPKTHHAIAYLVCLALLFFISSGKKWELQELTLSFIFFFILWKPLNNIYQD
ncbi:hypothetical protein QQ020_10000 [Fulvivirgaceae bacterium BMA12]|uniref:Uncharacterized protein n=1 Tax=Agaribacillus aureus TaxID=3051825 RepID=A0ABT8L3N7_9BACT|nr:hypothetical protein [Fulvivirgaceae bacterium BMA12]